MQPVGRSPDYNCKNIGKLCGIFWKSQSVYGKNVWYEKQIMQFFWGYILPRIVNRFRFKTTLTLIIFEVLQKNYFQSKIINNLISIKFYVCLFLSR